MVTVVLMMDRKDIMLYEDIPRHAPMVIGEAMGDASATHEREFVLMPFCQNVPLPAV